MTEGSWLQSLRLLDHSSSAVEERSGAQMSLSRECTDDPLPRQGDSSSTSPTTPVYLQFLNMLIYSKSRQILLEPLDPLLLRVVHGLLLLLVLPVAPEREPMHLIFVRHDLMRHVRLLVHDLLDLRNLLLVQQTVRRPERQAQRLLDRVEVARDGDERGVARVRRVDALLGLLAAVRGQYGVPAAPAEADDADLVRAGDHADGADEAVDERLADGLAVCHEPGAQRRARLGGVRRLLEQALLLAHGERRLDGLQELDGEGVALVHVWDVGVEAGLGVVVGEEADVLEFVAEDWEGVRGALQPLLVRVIGESLLSTRKTTVFDLEPSWGSATYVCRPPIVSTRPVGVPSWTLPERQQELIPTPVDMAVVRSCGLDRYGCQLQPEWCVRMWRCGDGDG